MAWLISDANIIIDMEVGGILDLMFKLPETFIVPDVLYLEELAEHHPDLPGFGLEIRSLRAEYVEETDRLREQYPEPSTNDLFALALAKQENCPLLTGDDALRKAAEMEEVDVNGTLWLVGRLLEQKLTTVEVIAEAYERMKRDGRRLPWAIVHEQLVSFGG